MKGRLYGVGVGPGDPELLTLKAVRLIKECEVVAIPANSKEKCVAYKIASQVIENIDDKEFLYVHMPMTKDENLLKESHNKASEQIANILDSGKSVAFLTLGDPSIYSTYIYIHKLLLNRGYETEIISGIPSFCAASAKINEGLVEKSEELHIIPASYEIKEALKLKGTKVFMKSGKKIGEVKKAIKENKNRAIMVENCGMGNEKVYKNLEDVKENASYYSLIIVKGE